MCPGATKSRMGEFYWSNDEGICNFIGMSIMISSMVDSKTSILLLLTCILVPKTGHSINIQSLLPAISDIWTLGLLPWVLSSQYCL